MMTPSLKKLTYFSGITALCAGVAFFIIQRDQAFFDSNENGAELTYLLTEDERAAITDMRTLRLQKGEDTLTLLKDDTGIWRAQEHEDFPASPSIVRQLSASLSQATRVEEKTSNPERYTILGLSEDSALKISGGASTDHPAFDIFFGNMSAQREGMYARRADEAAAYLISEQITVSPDITAWSDNRLFSIQQQHITALNISPAGDTAYTLKTTDVNGTLAWAMPDVPDGFSVRGQQPLRDIVATVNMLTTDQVLSKIDTTSVFEEAQLGNVVITLKDGGMLKIYFARDPAQSLNDTESNDEVLASSVYAMMSVTPPATIESQSDTATEKPLYDYEFMERASASHIFTVNGDIVADLLKPRADLLVKLDKNGKPILEEPQSVSR